MNKKLIAAAVAAGLAAPLAANAEVTVYGQLQAEIANIDVSGPTGVDPIPMQRSDVAQNESAITMADNKRGRLGFKASQDLGNGLTALAQFEWQVDTTTGDVNDGQRIGMVGLRGGFGQVEFGRLKTAYKYTGGVAYDPFVCTFLEARDESGAMFGSSFGQNGFWNDSVAYKGDFGNVGVWINYGVEEGTGLDDDPLTTGDGNDESGGANMGDISAALKFSGDAFEAFVAHSSDDSSELAMNKIGGQFKLAGMKISAQYEDGTTAADLDQNFAFIGLQYALGQNVLVAQIGQSEIDQAGGGSREADYFTVGAIHKLSKQTRVFAGYRDTSTETAGVSNDGSALSVGMRVDF